MQCIFVYVNTKMRDKLWKLRKIAVIAAIARHRPDRDCQYRRYCQRLPKLSLLPSFFNLGDLWQSMAILAISCWCDRGKMITNA
jgi:hypothetical protein